MEQRLEDQLKELLDKRACEEVLHRYGRTLDWLDEAGQARCFWPDAEVDFGFFRGSGADWAKAAIEQSRGSLRRWHVSTGVVVRVEGDRAEAESYALTANSAETEDGVTDTLFGGRYLDELEKRDGEWRLSKRKYVLDWTQQFPNALAATTKDFFLHVQDVREAGHPLYRPL